MHPLAARRTHCTLALALAVGATVPAAQAAFWYEGFSDYQPDTSIGGQSQGTGWGGQWWGSGLEVAAKTPGLAYAGLPTSPGGAVTAPPDNANVAWYLRSLGTTIGSDGSSLWLSFLLRPEAGAGLSAYGGLNLGGLFIGKSGINNGTDPSYGLEGHIDDIDASGLDASPGETVFFVLKASFLAGADRFELFVNPLPGLLAPGPGPDDVTKTNFDLGTTDFIAINNAGNWTIDEIRIADSYAAVTVPLPGVAGLVLGGLGVLAGVGAARGRSRGRSLEGLRKGSPFV